MSEWMKLTKELAIAMLAGVYAIEEKLQRKGASTYVFDLFNRHGLKTAMDFVDAQNLLSEAALDVLFSEPPESEDDVSEWISVKDRLPDNKKDVIVYDEFGLMYLAYYYTFDECWMYSFTADRCSPKITHWMPLPQNPESEDAE